MDALCTTQVLQHINNGADYKAACLVCRDWYRIARKLHRKGKKFTNHIVTLVKLFPDWGWDYNMLSRTVPFGYLEFTHPGWDWQCLSANPKLTYVYVIEHPTYPWNYKKMCRNPGLTWNQVMELCVGNYNYTELSFRRDVDWDFVEAHYQCGWNWHALSRNVPPHVFIKHSTWNWDWTAITANTPARIIAEHPGLPWNINTFSVYDNPDIMNIIRLFPDHSWDWKSIVRHHQLTVEFISEFPVILTYVKELTYSPWVKEYVEAFPDADWDWKCVGKRTMSIPEINEYAKLHNIHPVVDLFDDIPWEIVEACDRVIWSPFDYTIRNTLDYTDYDFTLREIYEAVKYGMSALYRKYPNIKWSYEKLSMCKLDIDIISDTSKPWNWITLSWRTHYKIILANPKLPWEMVQFSTNPSLSWRVVAKHPTLGWDAHIMQHNNTFHR